MADIFLSYARANHGSAKQIASKLRSGGFSVWFDEQLPAHRTYSDVIEEQLEAAKAVLVLWSAEAVRSQWVRSEANRARETGRLVQARLDEARLPMPFDQIQCADLSRWSGNLRSAAWQSVLSSIAALTGGGSNPSLTPTRAAGPQLQRRELIFAAGAVTILGGGGLLAWRLLDEPEMSPQARLLLQKGQDALQNNDALDPQGPGSTMQAIALLTQATEAAPQSADAWGSLAMAYAVRNKVAPLAERRGLQMRSRSAAQTALRLDPTESRALAALRLIEPVYRNWSAAERGALEAVRKGSSTPVLLFIMSDMLGQVGRWTDALQFSSRFDRSKWLIPGAERKVIVDFWSSGDLESADRALEAAVEHWPQHPQIWRTRLTYLMYSGRPVEALALLSDDAERPVDVPQDQVDAVRATAEALAGKRTASEAVKEQLAFLESNPSAALQIANALAALGAAEAAFRIFDGYYFGEGEWASVAPAAGDQDRITSPLFQPPMRSLWRDSRFDRLLERIGLNDYWRTSQTIPDFRRAL